MKKQLTETSKFLSYVLRHNPGEIGLTLSSEGWADLSELILAARKAGHDLAVELIRAVIDGSEKKRFAISEDGRLIRALQGHSTDAVDIRHQPKTPPEFLYHGTATRFLDSILAEGLLPGQRHHTHLAGDIPTAFAVGQRYGKPVVLKVEALRMYQDGFVFFQAENGVWLTEKVPASYFAPMSQA